MHKYSLGAPIFGLLNNANIWGVDWINIGMELPHK